MKAVPSFIPPPFKAIVFWLKQRRGLDLYGGINFTKGFKVGNIEVTPDHVKRLLALIETPTETPAETPAETPTVRRRRRAVASRDAPTETPTEE